MKESKVKGKQYEEFVAEVYKIEGYEIFLNGSKKGRFVWYNKDGTISEETTY